MREALVARFRPLQEYIFALFFFTWAATLLPHVIPTVRIVNTLIISGVVLFLVARKLNPERFIRMEKFALALTGFVLLRLLWLTRVPLPHYASLDQALNSVVWLIVFMFFVQHFNSWRKARAWENAVLSLGIVFAIFELLLAYLWYQNWWDISGTVFSLPPVGYRTLGGLLDHPNNMSAFLNLLIPLALIRFLVVESRSRKILWAGAVFLFAVIQFFTSSRTGWVGGGVGVSVTLILYFSHGKDINWRKIFNLRSIAMAGAGLVLLFIGGGFLFRLAEVTPGHGGRLGIWLNSWRVWQSNILLGNGTGSFALLYAQVVEAPPGFIANHGHNIFLQIGAEYGIPGLILLLLLFGIVANGWLLAWRNSRETGSPYDVLCAYAGALAATFVHHQGDYFFENIFYMISLIAVLAFIYVRIPAPGRKSSFRVRPKTLIAGSGLIILFGSWFALRGSFSYYRGILDGVRGDWKAASNEICGNDGPALRQSLHDFQCGLVLAKLYELSGDDTFLRQATSRLEQGLEEDPYWQVHRSNLSIAYWQLGESEKAIEALEKAVDRSPRNKVMLANLGWMYEETGNFEAAEEMYRLTLQEDLWFGESQFVEGSEFRRNLFSSDDFREYMESSGDDTIEAYRSLLEGRTEEAQRILEEELATEPLNARAHILLGWALEERGLHEEAWREANTGLLIRRTPELLIRAAEIALAQNREIEAIRWLEEGAALLQGNQFSATYYLFVYHRHTLPSDLLPGYLNVDLTPEMVERLVWLVNYYEDIGEMEKANNLSNWMRSTYANNQ